MKKNIFVFGSTGSIGIQTLEVLSKNNMYSVTGLSCNSNSNLLFEQVKLFNPSVVAINNIELSHDLINYCDRKNIKLFYGDNASNIVPLGNIDIAVNAIVGTSGLQPTIRLIESGIDVALSNKESLVLGGHIIMPLAKKNNVKILPVDSEHSAIFQCLHGENDAKLKKIILTGSGGPFLKRKLNTFKSITSKEALSHPNWEMGKKISIDSATMMNKALELVEALWLFNVNLEKIEIVIHPQSIVHSMVEFEDGSYKAHLGVPDMRVPIQYALTYPQREKTTVKSLDFTKMNLQFSKPSIDRYPTLSLVEKLINMGGNRVPIMSIANDYIVQKFLDEEIAFNEMFPLLKKTINQFSNNHLPTLEDLITLDNNIKLYLNPK
jgi:1-deoxy-D-xylulose-5-phosphate reductoisomerase